MWRGVAGAVLVGLLIAGASWGEDVVWTNPERLPAVFGRALQLQATTDPKHQGQDYVLVGPKGTATLARIAGPALIVRVWSTTSLNTSATVEMTVDGRKEVLYSKGALPAGVEDGDPLRALDGQAYWSYIPVAVKRQAVFTARNLSATESVKFYLQVGYRQAGAGDLELAARRNVEEMRAGVGFALKNPELCGPAKPLEGTLTPRAPWAPTLTGPSLVRVLRFDLGAGTYAQAATTRLVVTVDGQRTMDVPLTALFGLYWTQGDYASVGSAVSGQVWTWRFPIPVGQSLQLELKGWGGKPLESVAVRAYVEGLEAAPEYRLCAQYFSGVSVKDEPLHLLETSGAGLYVGGNLAVDGQARRTFAFLEGNEQIYVDGAKTPTLEGTGTEDYFNGAWYFESGVLARAFHGVTNKQDKDPPRVACYRYQIPDAVGFKTGIKVDLQHGSRNGAADVLYRAVMLWYQNGPMSVAEPVEAKVTKVEAGPEKGEGRAGTTLGLVVVAAVVLVVIVVGLRRKK